MNFKKIITLLLGLYADAFPRRCGSKGDGKGDAQGATAERSTPRFRTRRQGKRHHGREP